MRSFLPPRTPHRAKPSCNADLKESPHGCNINERFKIKVHLTAASEVFITLVPFTKVSRWVIRNDVIFNHSECMAVASVSSDAPILTLNSSQLFIS